MYFDRVKVAYEGEGKLSLIDKGVLCIHENGADSTIALIKTDSLLQVTGRKIKSVGAAVREDPEDAIKAGATALGVAVAKMAVGAVTGKNFGYVKYNNSYAKDFGKEIQRQEIKLSSDPSQLWLQRLDELVGMEQRENVIRLTTSSKQRYSIIFPQAKTAREAVEVISAQINAAQESSGKL